MPIEWANSRWKHVILWRTKYGKISGYGVVLDWVMGEFWRIFHYFLPWCWREQSVEELHNVGNPVSQGRWFIPCLWVCCVSCCLQDTAISWFSPQSRVRNNVRPLKLTVFSLFSYIGIVGVAEGRVRVPVENMFSDRLLLSKEGPTAILDTKSERLSVAGWLGPRLKGLIRNHRKILIIPGNTKYIYIYIYIFFFFF